MDIFTNNLSILEVMIVMIRLVWVQALLQQKIGKQPGPSESMMSLFRFKWCRDFRGRAWATSVAPVVEPRFPWAFEPAVPNWFARSPDSAPNILKGGLGGDWGTRPEHGQSQMCLSPSTSQLKQNVWNLWNLYPSFTPFLPTQWPIRRSIP